MSYRCQLAFVARPDPVEERLSLLPCFARCHFGVPGFALEWARWKIENPPLPGLLPEEDAWQSRNAPHFCKPCKP